MVGALTQHARHAKSQSAATFCKGAILNYTTIDPYNASLSTSPISTTPMYPFLNIHNPHFHLPQYPQPPSPPPQISKNPISISPNIHNPHFHLPQYPQPPFQPPHISTTLICTSPTFTFLTLYPGGRKADLNGSPYTKGSSGHSSRLQLTPPPPPSQTALIIQTTPLKFLAARK